MALDLFLSSRLLEAFGSQGQQSRLPGCHKARKRQESSEVMREVTVFSGPHSATQETRSSSLSLDPLLLAPAEPRTEDQVDPHTGTCSWRSFQSQGPWEGHPNPGEGGNRLSSWRVPFPSASPTAPEQYLAAAPAKGKRPCCLS